jgi:excisionase family DNA binding protein
MPDRTLLTVTEVARHLRVGPYTVYRYIKRGWLKAHRPARDWLISESDLEDFVHRRPISQPTSRPPDDYPEPRPDSVLRASEDPELTTIWGKPEEALYDESIPTTPYAPTG